MPAPLAQFYGGEKNGYPSSLIANRFGADDVDHPQLRFRRFARAGFLALLVVSFADEKVVLREPVNPHTAYHYVQHERRRGPGNQQVTLSDASHTTNSRALI